MSLDRRGGALLGLRQVGTLTREHPNRLLGTLVEVRGKTREDGFYINSQLDRVTKIVDRFSSQATRTVTIGHLTPLFHPVWSSPRTKSPTWMTPLPPKTPLDPKQGFSGLAESFPIRNFINTLYGTALSLIPLVGTTLGNQDQPCSLADRGPIF